MYRLRHKSIIFQCKWMQTIIRSRMRIIPCVYHSLSVILSGISLKTTFMMMKAKILKFVHGIITIDNQNDKTFWRLEIGNVNEFNSTNSFEFEIFLIIFLFPLLIDDCSLLMFLVPCFLFHFLWTLNVNSE